MPARKLGSTISLNGSTAVTGNRTRAIASASRDFQGTRSRISKKHHESEVHMTLVVAVEESRAGIVRCEIHLCGCVCRNDHHVLIQRGERLAIQIGDLEGMSVQM